MQSYLPAPTVTCHVDRCLIIVRSNSAKNTGHMEN
jgi:hypothetical protein